MRYLTSHSFMDGMRRIISSDAFITLSLALAIVFALALSSLL